MINNVTVVIRSSNERTEKLCYNLAAREVPEKNIQIIKVKPFSKAVQENFKIGIERNLKWTLALDADILLKKGAIEEMVNEFEKLDDCYYIYQGWVYDKFFLGFRSGGPHLYRTSLLSIAYDFIPKEGTSLRPESDTYRAMKKIGYHYFVDVKHFGLHDFEQYNKDIYRKFFLNAKKNQSFIPQFLTKWKKSLISDLDYQVAMRGLSDGLMFKETVFLNISFFADKTKILLNYISEKGNEVDNKKLEEIFTSNEYSKGVNSFIRDSRVDNVERRLIYRIRRKVYKRIHVWLESKGYY